MTEPVEASATHVTGTTHREVAEPVEAPATHVTGTTHREVAEHVDASRGRLADASPLLHILR
ncbi:hypothetical protein [Microbacterium sp. lyk4-40-TSB-66]|uniref:hypothetical protein n=1 Tax=Microbacterium sp. lyk4-40-TSB-66 TaxID=3040294 RepID=UPI00254CEAF7|nr:hypothetical protein [Microbacterium sp. lyk4-40-TSB-66]